MSDGNEFRASSTSDELQVVLNPHIQPKLTKPQLDLSLLEPDRPATSPPDSPRTTSSRLKKKLLRPLHPQAKSVDPGHATDAAPFDLSKPTIKISLGRARTTSLRRRSTQPDITALAAPIALRPCSETHLVDDSLTQEQLSMASKAATGFSAPGAGHAAQQVAMNVPGGPEESLRTFRLLEVLKDLGETQKASDTAALQNVLASFPTYRPEDGKTTPLHLTVRCAKLPVVQTVLAKRASDLNVKDACGATPLHLAAGAGRQDVVAVLLAQPDIDDTIRDMTGKTCLEVAKGPDEANLIQMSRSQFNATYLDLFAKYLENSSSSGLASSASSIHAGHTGNSHFRMQSASKDTAEDRSPARETLYAFLERPRAACIDFRAKLGGKNGITLLHEAARRRDLEMLRLCHSLGADLLVRDAKNKTPADSTKDEKIKAWIKQVTAAEGRSLKAGTGGLASASTGGQNSLVGQQALPARSDYLSKWTNMARGYKARWFVLDNGTLSYYRHKDDEGKASRGSIHMGIARVVGPSPDGLRFEVSNKAGKYPKLFLKADHPVQAARWIEDLKQHASIARSSTNGSNGFSDMSRAVSGSSSYPPSIAPTIDEGRKGDGSDDSDNQPAGTQHYDADAGSILADDDTFNGDGDGTGLPPHEENFELLKNSITAQAEATQQMLAALTVSTDNREVRDALVQSVRKTNAMIEEHFDQVKERERWQTRRFEREIDAKKLWEENMREAAAQHAVMEQELQRVALDNSRKKKVLKSVRASVNTGALVPTGSQQGISDDTPVASPDSGERPNLKPLQRTSRALSDVSGRPRRASIMPVIPAEDLSKAVDEVVSDSDEEDDDDEFFEAIEAGAVQIRADPIITEKKEPAWPDQMKAKADEQYGGYKQLRSALPITNDNRPPVSLWAILKGSIGKDLTKISFPVYFNEPTSMLQRMAEDMEFAECLDAAATERESSKRIAYVAAFAMSNYSSTIGRIAKPFNPMLSETFEYVRLERHYRYISEQVSHHPPISACIAESPDWSYFGEVDAKSKFLGKSFEIRPTGTAHCTLNLPKAWATGPDWPASVTQPDKVHEHYSWRKVTTSVSNFLMGTPQIDHFGDMEITNHRTGETCVLTFKPRGWRGKDACELKGCVKTASGAVAWEIAGRWNSQLVARRSGAGQGDLKPDDSIAGDSDEYILLWKNSPKPPNMPFNLTPYAITLNDINDTLKPWLPPTDCRLRPDQHEFEQGRFERANDLKTEMENLQRETKKKREAGQLPPHQPRWFKRTKEPDTGEGYWQPLRGADGMLEYWQEREKVGEARVKGGKSEWPDVTHIFGQYEIK
ncbi:hypothetical protein E5Q_04089 [Mixia osmundae IAM 14324]|uniref:PH domain-containing protein n=1 Tax=Mixia osmundae (strain CBS 9802 / IAM 14324 / JCM 22182 / KY 12970) TaxID=764103 RepID=G7E3K1_MIXOS|nr:hypothetical protein E5Q_04089 [Mixia osmundae IAM 14324]